MLPTCTDPLAGLIVTDATGTWLTVIPAVPVRPSLVAVMVAVPAEPPVTRPFEFTVAMPEALVLHETERPVSTLPAASRVVALS